MIRLIVSEGGGLWRDFRDPIPAGLSEVLGVVAGSDTDLQIYEAGDWVNERPALIPLVPAASYEVTARTNFEPNSKVTLSFGGDEVEFPVGLLRASTVAACLNSLAAMSAVGGVEVRPLESEPWKLSFEVTFREVGAQGDITLTAGTGQVTTVTEVTAGDGSTAEVVKLTLEQKTSATITDATTAPAATISNPETGVWRVTLDERATTGFWTLTVGGTDTTALEVDATADEVRSAILVADDGTGWTVRGDARQGYTLAANEATPPTVTITDSFDGWSGRGGALDLESQVQAARMTGAEIELTITKPSATGRREVFQQFFEA